MNPTGQAGPKRPRVRIENPVAAAALLWIVVERHFAATDEEFDAAYNLVVGLLEEANDARPNGDETIHPDRWEGGGGK